MNSKRTEVSWGGGSHSVLFDLKTGDFYPYCNLDQAAKVHETFGGSNYYRSISGCSGAGWIPSRLSLLTVSTYRVDSHYIEGGHDRPAILDGWSICAPQNHGSAEWPTKDGRDYPVIMEHPNKGVFLIPWNWVGAYFTGGGTDDPQNWEDKHVLLHFWQSPEVRVTADWEVKTPIGIRNPQLGRLAEHFGGFYTHFEADLGLNVLPFWSRLGLRPVGQYVFKWVRNIARTRYTVELSDVEMLQAAAPANVEVIAPDMYVQERRFQSHSDSPVESEYEAIGLFRFEQGNQVVEEDFELRLESDVALKLLARSEEAIASIREQLRSGAEKKAEWAFERQRDDLKRTEMAQLRSEWMANTVVLHTDEAVTADDSVAAGNCMLGTESWALEHFRSRKPEGITLGQLYPRFAGNWNVERVVEFKLRQLGEVFPSAVAEVEEEVLVDAEAPAETHEMSS